MLIDTHMHLKHRESSTEQTDTHMTASQPRRLPSLSMEPSPNKTSYLQVCSVCRINPPCTLLMDYLELSLPQVLPGSCIMMWQLELHTLLIHCLTEASLLSGLLPRRHLFIYLALLRRSACKCSSVYSKPLPKIAMFSRHSLFDTNNVHLWT